MIITKEEQIKIIDKWHTKEKSARDLLCFFEGMQAFRKLLAEKDKAEKEQKEHFEKLQEHYDSKSCGLKNAVFEIKGTKLLGVLSEQNKPE